MSTTTQSRNLAVQLPRQDSVGQGAGIRENSIPNVLHVGAQPQRKTEYHA